MIHSIIENQSQNFSTNSQMIPELKLETLQTYSKLSLQQNSVIKNFTENFKNIKNENENVNNSKDFSSQKQIVTNTQQEQAHQLSQEQKKYKNSRIGIDNISKIFSTQLFGSEENESKNHPKHHKLSIDLTNDFEKVSINKNQELIQNRKKDEKFNEDSPIAQLQQDGLIDSQNNLFSSNIIPQQILSDQQEQEESINIPLNQSNNITGTPTSSAFMKRLLSKQYFIDSPQSKLNIPFQYYMHYIYNQTLLLSQQVRIHAKNNFDQLQYLNEFRPQLDQLAPKIIDLPKPAHKKDLKTLVLDLDETLIHCINSAESCSQLNSVHDITLEQSKLQISLRPGLQDFLKQCSLIFEVIIFTASESDYAQKCIEQIDKNQLIDGVLSREDCIKYGDNQFLKDLRGLNRAEGSIIFVDNSLGAVKDIELLVPIVSFEGDHNDKQLEELFPYLKELSQVKDIRKRNKEMFQWELFQEVESFKKFFQLIRKNKRGLMEDQGF